MFSKYVNLVKRQQSFDFDFFVDAVHLRIDNQKHNQIF